MVTNAALIAKLAAAKEPSRALSDEVLKALGYKVMRDWNGWRWLKPGGNLVQTFDPTGNLQDIAELVPEGYRWSVFYHPDKGIAAEVYAVEETEPHAVDANKFGQVNGLRGNVATALSAALLKTMETEGAGDG